ncbi:hypothetical protein IFM89_015234, partial [Coptis chinensis]
MQIRALVITTKHPIKGVGEVVKLGSSTWINECCLELQKKKKDFSKTKSPDPLLFKFGDVQNIVPLNDVEKKESPKDLAQNFTYAMFK